jgi:hypothetical protein
MNVSLPWKTGIVDGQGLEVHSLVYNEAGSLIKVALLNHLHKHKDLSNAGNLPVKALVDPEEIRLIN